ncbi:SCO2521 family protein [Streptomyces sp. enrichment culture]|uniref:SCO2521 family protein n=1 Tax=Streptomyces sp. enrichment culture TaxID=1795815 RepID=UPI003F555B10
MDGPTEAAQLVLLGGEVRTCLLPTAAALPRRAVVDLLRLRLDEPVRVSRRPNLYVASPARLTGVDCALPTDDGSRVRGIGTVLSCASVTEGHVMQVNAYTGVTAAGPDARRPWGHYLTRPGVIEPLGKLPERATARGFLTGSRDTELDPGLLAEALLAEVLRQLLPDRAPPLRAPRTRLRWVALRAVEADRPRLERFTLEENGLRTVELRLPDGSVPGDVAAFCADLALHDWLLTALIRLLEDHPPGPRPDSSGAVLRAAVDHLLHLWMPGARVAAPLSGLWEVLERTPGFTRQWQSLAQRVGDRAPRTRPSP